MRAQEAEKTPGRSTESSALRQATAVAPASAAFDAGDMSPQSIVALQRSIGNAAVSRMIEESRHQHGSGCGHGQAAAEAAAPVQRSAVHDVLSSGGSPLDKATRTDMESRLGADFSDVRVHTGATAQRSAADIGARAYTSGSHVVIGNGGADKHTLAHELTHVIQQRQGPVAGTDNGSGLSVSDPADRFERAAEANAHRVMSGPAQHAAVPTDQHESSQVERMTVTPPVQRMQAPEEQPTTPAAMLDDFRNYLVAAHEADGQTAGQGGFEGDFWNYVPTRPYLAGRNPSQSVLAQFQAVWNAHMQARAAHAAAQEEAEQNATAHRRDTLVVNNRNTWEFGGQIHYGANVSANTFSEEDIQTLTRVAQGALSPREGNGVPLFFPVHSHLGNGGQGAAYAFILDADYRVNILVYAYAGSRNSSNQYRWGGGGYISGPPAIARAEDNARIQQSRALLPQP